MSNRFQDKIALITGGGSGIGRATALSFAREGARVVVADVDEEGGLRTAQMIEKQGGKATFVRTDVSIEEDVASMISATLDSFGRLDIAFNNAGIGGGRRPVHEWELADFRKVLSVNLEGVFLCLKHELAAMIKQGGGAIVNNASIAGLRGSPTLAGYVSSKHAVIGLTKVAALEYAPQGIRVNAVCPGWTDTAILQGIKDEPEVMARIIDRSPLKRLGRPEEIADAVLWLCAESASFVTGHSLVIDGGLTS